MADNPQKDDVTGIDTTGHEWDGIRELDNPLPRWWLYVFYACILYGVVYMALYPSVPLGKTYFGGLKNYSQREIVANELAAAKDAKGEFITRIENSDLVDIRNNDELLSFSLAGGRVAFLDNCAGCHGTGATGGPGYPNLADDSWLWGGELETIHQTISHGIRWDVDDDTRISEMPNFGGDELLEKDDMNAVAEYILSLTGRETMKSVVSTGEEIFADNCAACHMDDASGDRDIGAPALNDQIWLYGDKKENILAQLNRPKHGQMPAWAGRLDSATIKMLTVYVHSLGGAE